MANPQAGVPIYSLVDMELEDQDPVVESFLRDIFPQEPQDFDPETCDVPITAIQLDSDNPQDPDVSLATTSVPPIKHVIPEFRSTVKLPDPIRALYAMPDMLRSLQVSAVQLYSEL